MRARFLQRPKIVACLAVLFFVAYFFWFAGEGLKSDLTHDDLMNFWRSLIRPWPALIADNLVFFRFSPTYRPFGALVYKAFYDLFGLNLFPLRLFVLCLLLVNTFLAYVLGHRLSGSREAGALAALMLVCHAEFSHFYYNTGTFYDILCFFFYFTCFLYYLRLRQSNRYPGPGHVVMLCLLYALALDSKELAVSLPTMIGLYELIYHRPSSLSAKVLARWSVREGAWMWISGVMVGVYIAGRVTAPEGIAHIGRYEAVISLSEYLKQTSNYLNELFFLNQWFDGRKTLAFLLVLLVPAAWMRSRLLLFSWLLFTAGILPMAFIPPRSITAIYVALAGLAVHFAALLVLVRDRLMDRALGRRVFPAPDSAVATRQLVLFAALALFLVPVHFHYRLPLEAWSAEQRQIRSVIEEMRRLHPEMKKGARILIVRDPIGVEDTARLYDFATTFIAHLLYRDSTIIVDRLDIMDPKPDAAALADYDHILIWQDGRFVELQPSEVRLDGDYELRKIR